MAIEADECAPGRKSAGPVPPGGQDRALAPHSENPPLPADGTHRDRVPDTGSEADDSTQLLVRVAEEQAALHRVAMLVARGAAPEAVFASVAEEVAALFDADIATVIEFSPDGEVTRRAAHGLNSGTGTRFRLGPRFAAVSPVWQAGGAIRLDEDDLTSLDVPEVVRSEGACSSVNAAVLVEGRIWGVIGVGSRHGRLPPETEERLVSFTELTAIAVASAQASSELRGFAEEQAALRRVATLVARGAPPHEVFTSIVEEAGRLLRDDFVSMSRYDPDGTLTCVAAWSAFDLGRPLPTGVRWKLEGLNIQALVFESGRPMRMDDYDAGTGEAARDVRDLGLRASVGAPIWVEGRVWGVMTAFSRSGPLPADTEERLARFTDVAATVIAKSNASSELREFAEEQAALRRVATLVAGAAEPEEVLAAVTEEAGRLLGTNHAVTTRYNPDYSRTLVSAWSSTGTPLREGARATLGGRNVHTLVFETGRAARIDDYDAASGLPAEDGWAVGLRAAVAVPISIEGWLWGAMGVASTHDPLPADAEARLAGFTELVATAIANADARAALTASRARIVAAADAARQRIERDLLDAAQERLASLVRQLRQAQAVAPGASQLVLRLESMITEANDVLEQLREIARGLHPSVLADGGLGPALTALARRSAVPVRLDVRVDTQLPEPAELTAYYAVSESLANTTKHAHATAAEVEVTAELDVLRVRVRDDGRGGADFSRGSGLTGLKDRVEAVGGRISLRSRPGAGTTVEIELPLHQPASTSQARGVTAEHTQPAPGGRGGCFG
jgi:signal transduction histidine kinase